jgi:recombination protein RecA
MAKTNAFEEINSKYGKNTIRTIGEDSFINTPVIPTGSFSLDLALGVGGIPVGRIIEAFGPEASGKTTLCLGIIAQAQNLGKTAAFIDVEHALDPTWATTCGVDIGSVYISQPDNGEMAIDIIKTLIGEVDLVILDSVAGLVPKAELEGEVEDSHMALIARLMSKAMRILAGAAKESNTTIIFTNQLRQKIGVTWGNPEVTTGGKALQYWASVRLDIRRTGKIEEKGEVVGSTTKVTVRKNKVGPPLRVVDFNIYADEGISKLSEIIDFGISNGTINKKGAGWFTILPETEAIKVQGMGSVKEYMLNNPVVYQKLENELRKANNLPLVIDA